MKQFHGVKFSTCGIVLCTEKVIDFGAFLCKLFFLILRHDLANVLNFSGLISIWNLLALARVVGMNKNAGRCHLTQVGFWISVLETVCIFI